MTPMFNLLKNKISKLVDRLGAEDGKVTLKEKAGAFIAGEVVLDEKKLDKLGDELTTALIESDVAFDVAEKIILDLKRALYGKKFKRGEVVGAVKASLKNSLKEIFPEPRGRLVETIKSSQKPCVIVFVGINGTGKTTTIAKVARVLQKNNLTCVIAASDTYRAGAIEQLEKHAENLGIRLIKHARGADPAAVAYDAIEHARAHGKDAVLIDTAGRMETKVNLLDEMKKIIRVTTPNLVLFVGDALTGNAAVEQAERFNSAVALDGIILTKADADAKGGAAISIAHAIKKPIMFLGVGQGYDDLREFDAEWLVSEIVG